MTNDNDLNASDLEQKKAMTEARLLEAKVKAERQPALESACPSCGYCRSCGRGGVSYPYWGNWNRPYYYYGSGYISPNTAFDATTTAVGSGAFPANSSYRYPEAAE